MTVVTIEGIPLKHTVNQCVTMISKVIKFEFEALNFTPSSRSGMKTIHINIIDDTNVDECVQKLNGLKIQNLLLTAYIPKKQPYINPKIKKVKQGKKRNRHLKMPQDFRMTKEKMFNLTRSDLIYELQDKYTALMEINKAVGNKLLYELVRVIEERLRTVLDQSDNCFLLSSNYRFKHPHKTDFEMIQTCLSKTGSNVVLTKEMLKPTPVRYEAKLTDTIPVGTVHSALNKYSTAIYLELLKYVTDMPTDMQVAEGEQIDAAAQNEVRGHFKKLAPSMQLIIYESLKKHMLPTSNDSLLRIYGEPSLPKVATMQQFLGKYRGSLFRSPHLYNCVHAQVPNAELPALLAADSTCIEGRILVIRVFTKDIYKKILRDITAVASARNICDMDVKMDDEDAWENWDEEEDKKAIK